MAPSKKKAKAKKAAPAKAAARKTRPKAKAAAKKTSAKPAKKAASKKTAAKGGVKSAVRKSSPKAAVKTPSKKAGAKTTKSSIASVARKVAVVLAPVALTTLAVKAVSKKKASKSYVELMTPLDDRILVETEAASEVTAGGIIIPGTVDERPQRGRVVAVGRGRRNKKGKLRPIEISVGETVMFAESAGSKITVDGDDLLIIREDEVLGVVG